MTAQINAIPNPDLFKSGRDTFAIAYDNLLFNTELSDQAHRLFLILMRYGRNGECYPSQERLAADMGRTTRTIRAILDELYDHGLVDNLGRIKYRSNSYALADSSQPLIKIVPGAAASDSTSTPSQLDQPEENFRINRKKTSAKGEVFKEIQNVCENAPKRDEGEGQLGDITPVTLSGISDATASHDTTPKRDTSPYFAALDEKGQADRFARITAKLAAPEPETPAKTADTTPKPEPEEIKHTQPAVGDNQEPAPAAASQLTAEQAEIVKLLVSVGMATLDACRLAAQPHNTKAHVTGWIAYTRTKAYNPAGYLMRVLDRQDALPPAAKKARKASPSRSDGTTKQTAPIDFTKYTDNGKYAYLTNQDETRPAQSDQASDENTSQPSQHAAEPATTPPSQPVTTDPVATAAIDRQIKYAIRGFDREAFDWLQMTHIEGDTLQVRFNGQKQFNTDQWVRHLAVFGIKCIEAR